MTGDGDKPVAVVADDEDDILTLMAAAVSKAGCAVVKAHNGTEALALARERSPRLVVLDIAMPGMDGLDVLRHLKAEAETEHVPVILVSARAQEADVKQGYEAGAARYIRKPFSPRDLSAAAAELLA
jgi:DNA-binding response OmpR family regulator